MSRLEELYRMRAFLAAEILDAESDTHTRSKSPRPVPNTERVITTAADLYGVTAEAIIAGNREAQIARARQAACWLLRAHDLSFPQIGAALDLHHTTVMHACRKIDGDPAVRALLWPLLGRAA